MRRTSIPLLSLCLAAFWAVFVFSGCATVKIPPLPVDPATQEALQKIENQNAGVETFNGQGAITITEPSKVSSYRLAWAGEPPERIRLVVLFSGTPVETLASDGEYLYLKSHRGSHDPIKRKKKNPSLESYISLPLTTDQIICYLAGRIPIPDYEKAALAKKQGEKGSVLTFFRNGDTVVQRVFLDETSRATSYEITVNEKTHYHVTLRPSESGDGFLFPSTIRVTQKDLSCVIHIEKTTANPELSPETFVVTP